MAVGENNLQVQNSLLRKTLQEDSSGESYLVTVPSRAIDLSATVADRKLSILLQNDFAARTGE